MLRYALSRFGNWEQTRDAGLGLDPENSFCENGGDWQAGYPSSCDLFFVLLGWHGVGDYHLIQLRFLDVFKSLAWEQSVSGKTRDRQSTILLESFRGLNKCTGRVDDIVDDDGLLSCHIAH